MATSIGKYDARASSAGQGGSMAHHSCGHVEAVVGGPADVGIDVLESVQPEAHDAARPKREHGHRLSFRGADGGQSGLLHGMPADVREQGRLRIDTVGRGGGLMIAPAHVVEPEVPVENVVALLQAVD